MLYSLMKKVTLSLMDRGLLSYTRKIKHESRSSWDLHHYIDHIKFVFHVMVVEGQILSLHIQTHVLSLNRDPGHRGQVHLPLRGLLLLSSRAWFFNTSWMCPSAEQILVSVPCSFLWVLLNLDMLSPLISHGSGESLSGSNYSLYLQASLGKNTVFNRKNSW